MINPEFDDETLVAFADGELNELARARVARAIAADPDIAARAEQFRLSRARVANSLKPLADNAVPPGLKLSVEAMIERDAEARARKTRSDNVVPLGLGAGRRRPPRTPPWFAPLAACVVLMIGAAGGYLVGVTMPSQAQMEFASIRDPAIIQALSETPSGRQVDLKASGRTLEPIVSFQLEDGTLCREFRLREANAKSVLSIACLQSDRWETQLLMAANVASDAYVPAGSTETIDAYLASIHAGAPLDGSAEEQALRSIRH